MNVGLGVDPASSIAAASMTGFGALQPVADDAAYGRRRPMPVIRSTRRDRPSWVVFRRSSLI